LLIEVTVRYTDLKLLQTKELKLTLKGDLSTVRDIKELIKSELLSEGYPIDFKINIFVDGRLVNDDYKVQSRNKVLAVIDLRPDQVLKHYIDNIEIGKYVIYSCITSSPKEIISNIEELQSNECITQVLPLKILTSKYHILLAAYYAFKAFDTGKNISKKKYLEFLLYLLGNRQVSEVLNTLRNVQSEEYLTVTVCRKYSDMDPIKGKVSKYCVGDVKDIDEILSEASKDLNTLSKVYGIKAENQEKAVTLALLRTIELYLKKH